MAKWECSVCGYVYDPEKGDSISGIPSDTSFETLPDDWVCPACGAGKDSFEKNRRMRLKNKTAIITINLNHGLFPAWPLEKFQ